MPSPTQEIPLARWSDFAQQILRLDGMPDADLAAPPLHAPLFRGVGNSSWGLETTLERSYPSERCDDNLSLRLYYRKVYVARPAVETFSGRRWELPDPPTFDRSLKEHWSGWLDMILGDQVGIYEYLVYLRHHGFPSPLLDWTASPYVAAFFAFDSIAKEVERVSVYALLRRAGGGSTDEHCFMVGPNMRTHQRHFVQQCWYSMCVRLDQGSEDYVFLPQEAAIASAVGPARELLKFTMPAKERRVALQSLDLMNINPFSLFGSEDSLVRTIARRECYFKTWRP